MRNPVKALAILGTLSFVFAIAGCGDQAQGGAIAQETKALMAREEVTLYKNSGDNDSIGKFPGWDEVVTYNPDKPENKRIRVDLTDPNNKEKKINGWINAEDLLLKGKEAEGLVFNGANIYATAKPGVNKDKAKWLNRGVAVKWLGYKYTITQNDKGEKITPSLTVYKCAIGTEAGWIKDADLITDAHIGVMIEDAPVYQLPDKGAFKLPGPYKKYTLVPVLGEDKEWYKVLMTTKEPVYYIPDGKKVVSFKEEDIGFVRDIGQAYNGARTILDELSKAKEANDTNYKKLFPKEDEWTAKLKDRIKKLDGYMADLSKYYKDNGSSPFATDIGGEVQVINDQITELKVLLGLETPVDDSTSGSMDNGDNLKMNLD